MVSGTSASRATSARQRTVRFLRARAGFTYAVDADVADEEARRFRTAKLRARELLLAPGRHDAEGLARAERAGEHASRSEFGHDLRGNIDFVKEIRQECV